MEECVSVINWANATKIYGVVPRIPNIGQLHAPAALLKAKGPPVPTKYDIERALERAGALWRAVKSLVLPVIEPCEFQTQPSC
jgi:hypothetical protein